MSFYQTQGLIPSKRHTIFNRNANSIYYEELISRKGFSGIYSNVYHLRMPTKLESLGQMKTIEINKVQTKHKARHIKTKLISNFGDIIYDRIPLMFNSDLIVHKVHVNKSMDCFYRNVHFDELIYIQEGNGTLLTNFGNLSINKGDYIIAIGDLHGDCDIVIRLLRHAGLINHNNNWCGGKNRWIVNICNIYKESLINGYETIGHNNYHCMRSNIFFIWCSTDRFDTIKG